MNLAGKDLTDHLIKLMAESGRKFTKGEEKESERENARDTKEKKCFIVQDYEAELKAYTEHAQTKEFLYKLPDNHEIMLGSQLFKCPEALFNPSKIESKEKENQGIHELTF